jgi:serine/threonine-protein kinase
MVAVEASDKDEMATGTQVLRRYSIVGKLAQGGMAEVYLARQVGPAGYQKLVVIKRVRPHLANDADFVGMFVNEARLAAMINHPNVVQIFDLGDEPRPGSQGGGQDWFLAMEYLDGRDMLQVGRACRAHNKAVPFDVTARIIADACAGLDHAHGLKGPDGKSLELVHRDMSPENILITFEGQVKVVDFGIAKAKDNLIKTQAGQIKGKLGYVAPEAILGKPVDARADVFAIGATLYLFLSGRPAFSGSNPMEIFERSLKPPTPPREVNARVPEPLDAICMKALAQDRDKRYKSAGEVRAALEGYLQSTGRPLGPVQLSQFMRILFPPDKDPVRQRIDKLLADAPPVATEPRRNSSPPGIVSASVPEPLYIDDDKTNVVVPRPEASFPSPVTLNTVNAPVKAPPRSGPGNFRSTVADGAVGKAVSMGDMTHEEIDLRAAALDAPTMETTLPMPPMPPMPAIDIDELGDVDMSELVAAAADDDDDLITVKAASLQSVPSARQATMRSAIDDVASALPPGFSSHHDMAPPPPTEASRSVARPPPFELAPPPAFDPSPPPIAALASPIAVDASRPPPSSQPPAQHFDFEPAAPVPHPPAALGPPAQPEPSLLPPDAMGGFMPPPQEPPIGLRLAMLGFGALTGLALLTLFLVRSGLFGRITP